MFSQEVSEVSMNYNATSKEPMLLAAKHGCVSMLLQARLCLQAVKTAGRENFMEHTTMLQHI